MTLIVLQGKYTVDSIKMHFDEVIDADKPMKIQMHEYTSTNKDMLLKVGWQKLGDRRTAGPRNVRVFYERRNLQHTLFCCETRYFLQAFVELSPKDILLA